MDKRKGCCHTGPQESCCDDASRLFDFVPGYISAVLDGEGFNRLADDPSRGIGSARPNVLLSTASTTSSTSTIYPTQTSGFDGHDPSNAVYSVRYPNSAIAVIAVLASFLVASLAAHAFIWYKSPRNNTAKLLQAQPQNDTSAPISLTHYQGQHCTHIPGPFELDAMGTNGRPSELGGI